MCQWSSGGGVCEGQLGPQKRGIHEGNALQRRSDHEAWALGPILRRKVGLGLRESLADHYG